MTQEEKARAYDELKVKAQKLEEDGCFDKITLFDLFPELRESEDERTRKDLIIYLRSVLSNKKYGDKIIESWIAWLENIQYTIDHAKREGFQLGYKAGIEKQGEQKPVDKIQLGKKYKCIASPRYSTFMIGKIYKPEDKFLCSLMNFCFDCFEPIEDDEQEPIKEHDICGTCDEKASCVNPCPTKLIEEQKSANKVEPKFKIGDIISDGFSEVEIVSIDKNRYNVTNDEIENDAHIGNWVVYFKDQDNWKLVEQTPADKVDQHSLPVSDNSSLPTFDESIYHPCTEEVYKQKSAAWSEEDENTLLDTINILCSCGKCSTDRKLWLLSLRNRIQPKYGRSHTRINIQ